MLERALDAGLEADDEAAIVLELVLLAEDLRLRRMDLREIFLQALEKGIADRALLRTGGEQVGDLFELALVEVEQVPAS